MKYLVMETHNSYAVLLDEDGRFVKSANPGYEIGETIKNPVIMRSEPLEEVKKPKKVQKILTTIAAIFALVIGVNVYRNNYMPDSSIYIAINPKVQMLLNKKGAVLDLKGTNLDGEDLVNQYEKRSSDKSEVTDDLIDLAIEMGFLSEGGRVSIGIDTADPETFKAYGIELRQSLKKRESIQIEITELEEMASSENKTTEKEGKDSKEEVLGEKNTENKEKIENKTPIKKKEAKEKRIEKDRISEKKNPLDEKVEEVEDVEEIEKEEKIEYITANEAKSIALFHAGLKESEVEIEQIELKEEDGVFYYEIEFDKEEDEYEYEIHAITKKILDYEHDLADEEDDENKDEDRP